MKKKRIDPKELNETISEIVQARNIQKAKVEKKKLVEEIQEEEVAKFHKPVVKEVGKIVPAIEQSSTKTAKAIEASNTKMIKDITSSIPKHTSSIPQLPSSLPPLSNLTIDPNKDIDIELITAYKLLKPSELLNENDAEQIIEAYIPDINKKLQSWGGQIRSKKEDSDEYRELRRKIDGFKKYRDRIRQIPEALSLQQGKGLKHKKVKCNKLTTGSKIQYVYYNNPDDLFKRLELLCAERDIGNDSIELRNEVVSILDLLLKQNVITSNEHKKLYSKWC